MNEGGDPVETKQCSNCGQPIEKPKFMLHEAYCLRHMYKCKCGEVVCKAEREEHEEEKHVKVSCKFCAFQAMKHEFGSHEETCDKKPKLCSFCEQMIDFDNFLQHVNFCGARTRHCEFCKRNVLMRNQKYHEQTECQQFMREDYEKVEREKIKQLEEEEKREAKLQEMQRARRAMKEDKEKFKAKEAEPKPKPKPVAERHIPPPSNERVLPSYLKGPSDKSNAVKPKPREAAPISSSYKPAYRSKLAKQPAKEEAKEKLGAPKIKTSSKPEVRKERSEAKPSLVQPKSSLVQSKLSAGQQKPSTLKSKAASHNVPPAYYENISDEIPVELLNQIYAEDLDQMEVERIQNKEYEAQHKPPSRVAQRLIDDDVDMRDAYEMPRPRQVSPPIRRPPPPNPVGAHVDDNEDEMIQRAIAESLKGNDAGNYGMYEFE